MRAISTFKTLSEQLDPFWLSRESHLDKLIDPKQPQNGSPDQRRAKMAPQGTPIKYGRMAPSLEPFWLS